MPSSLTTSFQPIAYPQMLNIFANLIKHKSKSMFEMTEIFIFVLHFENPIHP